MNLIGYSDSEGSDSDIASVPKLAPKPAPKATFQKVDSGKIKLNLPAPSHRNIEKDEIDSEAPPAKKQRVGGGAFGGFNAMLPAPKKANAAIPAASASTDGGTIVSGRLGSGNKLGSGINLKTGSEPAFQREPKIIDNHEATGIPMNNDAFRASLNLSAPDTDTKKQIRLLARASEQVPSKTIETSKPAKKSMTFMPLSVARGKKKKSAAPRALSDSNVDGSTLDTARPVAEPKQMPKPKISLFSVTQETQTPSTNGGADGDYEPLLYGQGAADDDMAIPDDAFRETFHDHSQQTYDRSISVTTNTAPGNLTDIASELNLTASQRRQLFGRKGDEDLSAINIVDFNTDREYAHNEKVRAQGETIQHNALKSISGTGKNSLRSLINTAVTQKDALEDHFAQGKQNKREAGNKYGW